MKYAIIALVLLAACGPMVQTASDTTAPAGPDTCGAAAQQGLIGLDAAAALILPEPKRVYRTDEAVTMDFQAERINVLLDNTDTIIAVRCG